MKSPATHTHAVDDRLSNLLSDWFGQRSSETFVHTGSQDRSDWHKQYRSGFSGYLIREKGPINLMKVAFKLCRNRLSVMLPGKSIGLSFYGKDSFTNGKNIVISTEVVDERSLSETEKLDVLLGLTTHEAAHVLHTNFSLAYVRDKFQKTILNILEDERIEFLVGEEFPGYSISLEKLKSYYFDFCYKKKTHSEDHQVAFDCFFRLVRFPKYVDVRQVEQHLELLEQIKACITPYPLTFIDTYHASIAIADLFEAYFGKIHNDDQDEVNNIKNGISEDYRDLEVTSRGNSQTLKESKALEDPMAEELIRDEASFDSDTRTYFVKAEDRPSAYHQVRQLVMADARSLANVLIAETTNRPSVLRGMRNGKLDDARLVDAYLGRPHVYMQTHEKSAPLIKVILMVDESGSMGGEKIQHAQRVAVLFNEAFKYIPKSSLSIYGFTSDYSDSDTNTITIYREDGFKRPYALGQMKDKASNRDGVCIRALINKLKRPTSKTLLFVISDGSPAGSNYYGEAAIKDTRLAVEEATRKGYIPIQIGIEVDSETQSLMFTDHVNYDSSKQMVEAIRKLLRNKLAKTLGIQ